MNKETKIYTCPVCHIYGTNLETIEKGFCHQRSNSHHYSDGKSEKKKRPSFKTQTSIKKFDSYFE